MKRHRNIIRRGLAAGLMLGAAGFAHAVGITVTATDDQSDGPTGGISLRDAILFANANPGPDSISLPPGDYALSLGTSDELYFGTANAPATGDLDITEDLEIIGDPVTPPTINANGIDRVFDVHGVNFALSDVALTNGVVGASLPGPNEGGAIFLRAKNANGDFVGGKSLTINRVTISACSAFGNGSAVSARSAFGQAANSLLLQRSTISGCVTSSGGAVHALLSNYQIDGCVFTGNSAAATAGIGTGGGALLLNHGAAGVTTALVRGNSFTGNTSDGLGGAVVSFFNGTETMAFNRFHSNSSSGDVFDVYNYGGTPQAANNWWGENTGPGGADVVDAAGGTTGLATYLKLTLTATPNVILPNGVSNLLASLNSNNLGQVVASGFPNHVPDITPIGLWQAVGGDVVGDMHLTGGEAHGTFTASASLGLDGVNVYVDNAFAQAGITVQSHRAFGDLNEDGCTDIQDFLLLLDNWGLDFNGQEVGIQDFLALLDYWNTGATCP